jgi:hypothetical protein
MSPLDAALRYAARGWPVFPCRSTEPGRKRPLTPNGFHDATTDLERIRAWWETWPDALIGVPTGSAIGAVVLDIDVKDDLANGFDTLEDLGRLLLDTPMAHTASGGLHVYFTQPNRELKCSAGLIGPGLDVRATGGYVIVPSPGSGYTWDPILNFKTSPLAPAPDWLWPPRPSRPAITGPIVPVIGLDRYGAAAIESACDAIAKAPVGQQERVLNAECFSIGTAAGAGLLPADIAIPALLRAAATMPDYDPRLPWRHEEIDFKVRRAFQAGQATPREVRRAVA